MKKSEKNKSGKGIVILAVILAVLLVMAVVLTVILIPKYPKMEYDEEKGTYLINGREYLFASVSYEPVTYLDKYADFGSDTVYEMKDISPERWLYSDIGIVFYEKSEKLPKLSETKPDRMYICNGDVCVGTVEDEKILALLTDALTEGEALEGIDSDKVTNYYTCRFASDEYPFLYYTVTFMHTDDGNFLFDRGEKKTVSIGETDIGELALYYYGDE